MFFWILRTLSTRMFRQPLPHFEVHAENLLAHNCRLATSYAESAVIRTAIKPIIVSPRPCGPRLVRELDLCTHTFWQATL